jgi:arginyl-tRNA synthetase
MKKDIVSVLKASLESMGISNYPEVEVEIPKVGSFGDISSPIAMTLSKTLRKPPRKIAEQIASNIKGRDIFEKIEIAGPGFINFTFSREYLFSSIVKILSSERSFFRTDIGNGRSVLVEYVSANPTGPLHIGHARGAAVGNALCNLLEESGFRVEREYYINDAGRQMRLLGMSIFAKYLQIAGEVSGFPEEGYRGQYIEEEASALLEEKGERYRGLSFEECEKEIISWAYFRMMNLIKRDLASFKVREFTSWVSEKGLLEKGGVQKAIDDLRERDLLYQADGAVWFRSSEFGDDKDRVIVKRDGELTYFASDIAYHKYKMDRGFDIIIDVWGADHHGYVPRIEAVMKAFGYDRTKFEVVLVQMVNLLKHGEPYQMSKRAGNFVTLSEVIDLVGSDTTKFIFLTRKSDSHLDFDIDVVTANSAENPVYYVQYANARINSIFRNAEDHGLDIRGLEKQDLSPLGGEEELALIKKLLVYPMVLEGAARAHEPHRVTFYLQELAGMFHPYYHKYRVIGDDTGTTMARLALCGAVKKVLNDALSILGVTAPERM